MTGHPGQLELQLLDQQVAPTQFRDMTENNGIALGDDRLQRSDVIGKISHVRHGFNLPCFASPVNPENHFTLSSAVAMSSA